jgi:hypothetical protein
MELPHNGETGKTKPLRALILLQCYELPCECWMRNSAATVRRRILTSRPISRLVGASIQIIMAIPNNSMTRHLTNFLTSQLGTSSTNPRSEWFWQEARPGPNFMLYLLISVFFQHVATPKPQGRDAPTELSETVILLAHRVASSGEPAPPLREPARCRRETR